MFNQQNGYMHFVAGFQALLKQKESQQPEAGTDQQATDYVRDEQVSSQPELSCYVIPHKLLVQAQLKNIVLSLDNTSPFYLSSSLCIFFFCRHTMYTRRILQQKIICLVFYSWLGVSHLMLIYFQVDPLIEESVAQLLPGQCSPVQQADDGRANLMEVDVSVYAVT